MELKAGTRLRSAVSDAQVIVIRAPAGDVELTCGGVLMIEGDGDGGGQAIQPGSEGSVVLGKRYVDEDDALEVLCTKPGEGALALGGHELGLKSAKPLPSSD
ncbi:MAG: hypothetical protein WBG41_07405 [Acidimicrobiales bacterium]